MFCFDDSIRIPVSREGKREFQQACKATNGKHMTTVARDLFSAYIKAVRKAMVFPGNYEAPNYQEVITTATHKEGVGLWIPKR